MILRRLDLENWRCFVQPLSVGPFGDGLNVLHGPNGVGKSTLMMALVRGLFDNHNVSGEAIRTLRPWGRQLAPKVTIEFEHDGTAYRIEKQFLDSPKALLSRKEGDQFVPLAEGRAADEQARQILSADVPGRGLTDERHWGLAQILWAAQGHLQIAQLSSGTQAAIRESLGAQLSGPGADALEKRITAEYSRSFTSRGKPRGGASAPPVVGLRKEQAEDERRRLLERLEQFEQVSRRIEDLRRQAEQSKRDEDELLTELEKTRQQAQKYKELLAKKELHEQEVRAAVESYNALKARIAQIDELRNVLDEVRQKIRKLEENEPVLREQLEQAEEREKQAKKAVADARTRRKEAQTAQKKADSAGRFIQSRREVQELGQLLDKIEEAERELARLREQRQQIVAPDAETLKKIQKTARTRDDARLQLDAAVITVRIEPEGTADVDVLVAEEPGRRTLAPGEPVTIKGAPDVAFRLPGVGRFEATGPTKDVEKLRKKWQRACEELENLTAGYGTQDIAQLEALHRRADDLDRQIDQINSKIETLLAGRDADTIRQERTRADRVVHEILKEFPEWAETSPDPEALSDVAERLEREVSDEIKTAEHELELARKAVDSEREKMIRHEADLKNARNKFDETTAQLQSHCDDGRTDAERAERLNELAMDRDAAKGRLQDVEKQLEPFEGDPSVVVRQLEKQLQAVREEADRARDELKTEEGRIQELAAEAPYSKLAQVEETIGRLKKEIAEQQLQLDAIRLLHDVLQEEKGRVLEAVVEPVRRRATQTLQRIAGRRFEDIRFGDDLLPEEIAPRAFGQSVPLEQISGGEREQVYFAVRLALAEVAFPDQRQLLVLDDVFTYTDTVRLARIATILDEAAERFQILLLTCHPERYRGLAEASFFDLAAISGRR
ncbi:MAG: SMC family ATPase [Planctomycetes bacterium]|nr:SMC family ATPase [Planctomycetota bacterium]